MNWLTRLNIKSVVVSAALLLSASTLAETITVEHKYGELNLDEKPQRVVSVGYSDQDDILSFGVKPLAVRYWYGDFPYSVWPWAQDELGDAKPLVLKGQALDYEAIAELKPDLIVGSSSGMDLDTYNKLSAIAPTLAQSGDYADWTMPWDVRHEMIGAALGFKEQAKNNVSDIQSKIEGLKDTYPEFFGKTATVAFYYNKQPGAYSSKDLRSRFLTNLGFIIPAEIDELAGDAFYTSFSEERMDLLDNDLLVWLASEKEIEAAGNSIFRKRMPFYKQGREYFTGEVVGGAFSFFSPLSIEYLIDEMVPELSEIVKK